MSLVLSGSSLLRTRLSTLAAMGISGASPAAYQPPDSGTIVVTGRAIAEEEARAQSRAFVRDVAAIPTGGQFARWNRPICPRVLELDAKLAARVEKIIREVGEAAGAKIAKTACDANLVVVFTDDAIGQMRRIAKVRPRMLAGMQPREKDMLLTSNRPVRWWYSTRLEGSGGEQANTTSAALMTAQIEGGGGIDVGTDANVISSTSGTLISTKVRAEVVDAGVVVDVKRAEGYTLDAIAAYIAMISLAQVRLTAEAPQSSSILGLFARPPGQTTADDLTEQDRAFLAALYKIKPDRDARKQRGLIVAEMIRQLAKH